MNTLTAAAIEAAAFDPTLHVSCYRKHGRIVTVKYRGTKRLASILRNSHLRVYIVTETIGNEFVPHEFTTRREALAKFNSIL